MCLLSPAQVQGISVRVLDDTAVRVTWERVSLPLEEVTGYTVYYSPTQSLKRQSGGTAMFANDASSGVIDGLSTGVRYQFEVTVTAMNVDGTELDGERSEVNKDSTVTAGELEGKSIIVLSMYEKYACLYMSYRHYSCYPCS